MAHRPELIGDRPDRRAERLAGITAALGDRGRFGRGALESVGSGVVDNGSAAGIVVTGPASGWDEAIARIDDVGALLERGVLIPLEAVQRIADAAEAFAAAPGAASEVQFVADYALEAGERIALHPRRLDRALAMQLRERLGLAALRPALEEQRDLHLLGLDLRLAQGDTAAREELVELCGRGRVAHRSLFVLSGTARRVVEIAGAYRRVDALVASVRPDGGPGRVASRSDNPAEFGRSLDLLARLAADPDCEEGPQAREALVELTDWFETIGPAAIRLPFHLLTDADRGRLLATFERRVELVERDPIVVPTPVGYLRDTDVLRGAVFQAMDAARIVARLADEDSP